MDAVAVSVLAIVIGAIVISAFFVDGLPAQIKERKCQGAAWRRAFPNVAKQAIREYLLVFVDAFAFRESDRMQFNPHDKIMDVYRLVYPKHWVPDALELETFAEVLDKRFGFRVESIWSEQLTLGDVFQAINARRFST